MKNIDKKFDKSSLSDDKKNSKAQEGGEAENNDFPGYPHYPASEDIYNNAKETDLNPEDVSKVKKQPEIPGKRNVKDFKEDLTGEDLDVPGSKADEAKFNAGSEDEENNYYSLGGDAQNDLEEDNG